MRLTPDTCAADRHMHVSIVPHLHAAVRSAQAAPARQLRLLSHPPSQLLSHLRQQSATRRTFDIACEPEQAPQQYETGANEAPGGAARGTHKVQLVPSPPLCYLPLTSPRPGPLCQVLGEHPH